MLPRLHHLSHWRKLSLLLKMRLMVRITSTLHPYNISPKTTDLWLSHIQCKFKIKPRGRGTTLSLMPTLESSCMWQILSAKLPYVKLSPRALINVLTLLSVPRPANSEAKFDFGLWDPHRPIGCRLIAFWLALGRENELRVSILQGFCLTGLYMILILPSSTTTWARLIRS